MIKQYSLKTSWTQKTEQTVNNFPGPSLFICDFTDCKRVWMKASREIRPEFFCKHIREIINMKFTIDIIEWNLSQLTVHPHEYSCISWTTWTSSVLYLHPWGMLMGTTPCTHLWPVTCASHYYLPLMPGNLKPFRT